MSSSTLNPFALDPDAIRRLERSMLAIPLPSRDLPGWESQTAHAYARAIERLHRLVQRAQDALAAAARSVP